jgi:PhnB protein
MRIAAYLSFSGNCREAMEFYKQCLGGELSFQTMEDSPHGKALMNTLKNKILHASLINKQFSLLATDMTDEAGLYSGNSVSIFLNCNNESETRNIFHKLSDGAKQKQELVKNDYGTLTGYLVDKFGIPWLVVNTR